MAVIKITRIWTRSSCLHNDDFQLVSFGLYWTVVVYFLLVVLIHSSLSSFRPWTQKILAGSSYMWTSWPAQNLYSTRSSNTALSSSQDCLPKGAVSFSTVTSQFQELSATVGRGNNIWISTKGNAMFSLQMHIPLGSPLGKALPLVQHMTMVAVVSGIRSQPGYEVLQGRIWKLVFFL